MLPQGTMEKLTTENVTSFTAKYTGKSATLTEDGNFIIVLLNYWRWVAMEVEAKGIKERLLQSIGKVGKSNSGFVGKDAITYIPVKDTILSGRGTNCIIKANDILKTIETYADIRVYGTVDINGSVFATEIEFNDSRN